MMSKKIILSLTAVVFALGFAVNSAQADTFTRDLTLNSTGPDVVALQDILVRDSYLVIPPGIAKGHFGILTKAAVMAWQAEAGISPAVGFFGPKSRGVMNTVALAAPGTAVSATTTASSELVCPNGNTFASNCTLAPGGAGGALLCPNGKTFASNCTAFANTRSTSRGGSSSGSSSNNTSNNDDDNDDSNTVSLNVTSPNAGDRWTIGQTKVITWQTNVISNEYRHRNVFLINSSGQIAAMLADENSSGWGSSIQFTWVVGASVSGGTTIPAGDYKIRVRYESPFESSYPSILTDDSSTFSMVAAPVTTRTLTVTSPNGGESWAIGQSKEITWQTNALTTDYRDRSIFLLNASGEPIFYIADTLTEGWGLTRFTWKVGDSFMNATGGLAPGSYKIRVLYERPFESSFPSTVQDDSNGTFTVTAN